MSLAPAKQNLTILQGATFYKQIVFKVNGEVEDLTDFDATLVVKDEPQGQTLLTLGVVEPEESGIVLGGVTGTIEVTITDEDTAKIEWLNGVYELFLEDDTGRTDVILRGGIKFIPF